MNPVFDGAVWFYQNGHFLLKLNRTHLLTGEIYARQMLGYFFMGLKASASSSFRYSQYIRLYQHQITWYISLRKKFLKKFWFLTIPFLEGSRTEDPSAQGCSLSAAHPTSHRLQKSQLSVKENFYANFVFLKSTTMIRLKQKREKYVQQGNAHCNYYYINSVQH